MRSSLASIPEHLEGEPALRDESIPRRLGQALFVHLTLLIMLGIGAITWPPYLLGRLLFGRPPITPPLGLVLSMVWHTLTERTSLSLATLWTRYFILLHMAISYLFAAFWGLCWFVDELLFGRQLKQVRIERPLLEISAARSGSTQLAHYLEDDPHIVAPSVLHTLFPYVFMWRYIAPILKPLVPIERVQRLVNSQVPESFLQRHELNIMRTDTFEVMFCSSHLMNMPQLLGPAYFRRMWAHRRDRQDNPIVWEQDLPDFIDALGKKLLLFAGRTAQGEKRKLMIKGHFLSSAPILESRYPDAIFLTMIRDPAKRLQSFINYIHAQPTLPALGGISFDDLVEYALDAEVEYCHFEKAFFDKSQGADRVVLRFDDYVRDLEGTMRRVYNECLAIQELPPHVPRVHAERKRTNYAVDRTLAELGIDEAELREELKDYALWCKPTRPARQ